MAQNNTRGLVGFLLFLSSLDPTAATAALDKDSETDINKNFEQRLSAITEAFQTREQQIEELPDNQTTDLDLSQWKNQPVSNDFQNWRNRWQDGGAFANWRNNWNDGNRFIDYPTWW